MNDYERVARLIRYLDDHRAEQPSLDALAAVAGLSRFHLHRLFTRWTGVTPKNFLKCLTWQDASERLRSGVSVLDATLDAGLSSPGRLHDLCVTLEAASPGEIRSGGAGWTLEAGIAESPFGPCLLALSPRGICHLEFLNSPNPAQPLEYLKKKWPAARVELHPRAIGRIAERIFRPESSGEERLAAYVRGTPFQIRVWRELLKVPPGHLTSYGRLAGAAGFPKAVRAVGTAVGANPLAFLIPCHRVIRETGVMGQYRWGPERKRLLLTWEVLRHSQGAGE